MTQVPNAMDVLANSGTAPEPAKFAHVGATISGVLVSDPQTYHAREYDPRNPGSGAPKYTQNGDPVYGVRVDIDVPGVGIRRLYADKPRLIAAIRQAYQAAGAATIARGGTLSVTWTGQEAGQGAQPANTYAASYTPPGVVSPTAVLSAAPGVIQAIPAQAPAPAVSAPQVPAQRFDLGAVAQAAVPPVAVPQVPVIADPAPAPAAGPTITATIAAAMANAGISTDGYTIVPG